MAATATILVGYDRHQLDTSFKQRYTINLIEGHGVALIILNHEGREIGKTYYGLSADAECLAGGIFDLVSRYVETPEPAFAGRDGRDHVQIHIVILSRWSLLNDISVEILKRRRQGYNRVSIYRSDTSSE
jgi:hypothetical protein